jgi:RNA polymerase sigma-70 factor (ECF subfamily)
MHSAAGLELVRRAKEGDEAAFTSLLRPLLEPAYRLAFGMLQDRALAEDAVQEAALKAWRKIHQLREGFQISPWFYGIVANECRMSRRSPWWSLVKTAAPAGSSIAPDGLGAERIDLRRALKELPLQQRLVVVMYFYLDLPLEEIARITGVSFAAARGRLYRAIEHLRSALGPEEAEA